LTDLADGFDFTAAANEAIAAAEPAAAEPVVEEAAVAEVAEETPPVDDRPRDEQGRFVAAEPAAEDAAEQLAALQKRLADKDEFINRQGNEIGELRKAFEEGFSSLGEKINSPARRISEDLIDRDPAGATRLAFEQGDQQSLAVAFQAWKDEDPASAGAWAAYTASQQEILAQRQAYEQRLAELEARIDPVAQANTDQRTARQVREITSKYGADEISAFVQSDAFTDLANEFPWARQALMEDPAPTIESLFLVHRGRTADTLTRTVQEVARETAEQAAQATSDAYVASASTASATTAEPKTEADLIREGMIARITHKESVWRDGWTHG
jgi:hypothetical protein